MTKEEYLSNPCKASSLPFWKTQTFSVSPSIQVIRDDLYKGHHQNESQYFKMVHYLKKIEKPSLPNGFSLCEISIEEYAKHINQCYEEEHIEIDELENYKTRPVYNPNLWIAVKDNNTNEIVATAIGETDLEIGEGILEWIQVSKPYRRKGLGKFLVNYLLTKMKQIVVFVTVSGRIDNVNEPIELYKSCGFIDAIIWHVIKR